MRAARFFVPAFVAFVVFVVPVTPAGAQGKKVYISVDMEGISGVNGDDQTSAGGADAAAHAS